MAYDEKYRAQAVAFKQSGHSFKELKEVFKICTKTYYDWVALYEKHGVYSSPKVAQKRQCKIVTEELKQAIEEKPDAYLHELAEPFNCTPQAVFYALKAMGITYKKRHLPTKKNLKNCVKTI